MREVPGIVEAIVGGEVRLERHICHRNLVYIFALLASVSYPKFRLGRRCEIEDLQSRYMSF